MFYQVKILKSLEFCVSKMFLSKSRINLRKKLNVLKPYLNWNQSHPRIYHFEMIQFSLSACLFQPEVLDVGQISKLDFNVHKKS
jgi:hypothetical protein